MARGWMYRTLLRYANGAPVFALLAGLILAPCDSRAQDSHYWSQHYGPRGELLAGVTVGSALDLSSTYYNPGGLAMREDPAFLLSVQAFQNERLDVDFGGGGDALAGGGFSGAPSLISGSLPAGWLGQNTRLAWSYLTRQRFNVRTLTRLSTERGSVLPPTRFDHVSAELLFDQRMSEDWGGLTWSRRFGSVGVGLTQFVAYRSQRTRYEINAQGASADGRGNAVLSVDEFDYNHWRTLTKVGLFVERPRVSLGVAVTMPSVALFGSAKSGFTLSVTGDVDDDGRPESVLDENFLEGLSTDYRSPLSIAAGASWRYRRSRIHATAEWFDSVSRFPVVKIPAGEKLLDATQAFESVINFGVGLEHSFASGIEIFAAVATDRSAREPVSEETFSDVSLASWDMIHLTTGVSFDVGANSFTLGVGYASGSDQREVSLLPDSAQGAVLPVPALGEFSYRRLKFILGYSFGS